VRSCYAENGGFDWVKRGHGVLVGYYDPDLMTQSEQGMVLSLLYFDSVGVKLVASYFVVVVAYFVVAADTFDVGDFVDNAVDVGGFDWVKRGYHEPLDPP